MIEARQELEQFKQQGRVDLEKVRALSRKDAQGKTLTRMEFLNRHLNSVATSLQKNYENQGKNASPQQLQAEAIKILNASYDAIPQDQPKQAPVAPGGTKDDPLGLFSK